MKLQTLLIVTSICILVYLFSKFLFIHAKQWLNVRETFENKKCSIDACEGATEGFFGTPDTELSSLNNKSVPVQVSSTNKEQSNEILQDYVVKGSYNSAITGNYANEEMIKYVLERGCRFLDFEVFMVDNKPQVSYSVDKTFETRETENSILLDNALNRAVSSAFARPSPNYEDPLFIQLRVKSKDHSIYKMIAKSVDYSLRTKLYKKKVDGNTKLSDILGKVVLVFDKSYESNYADYCKCEKGEKTCYDLTKYINIESGTSSLFSNTFTEMLAENTYPLTIKDGCNLCTNVEKYRIALPSKRIKNEKNPELKELVLGHAIQINLFRFYLKGDELDEYEEFFNNFQSSFVPLASMIQYYKNQEEIEE
uniref:Phosphatidylinositol-specific phospholipase C X domain-containing protein n=1 Tax=viral metagenome TaxID=1070528 RepID=A0A6C0INA9_9ZZZZ